MELLPDAENFGLLKTIDLILLVGKFKGIILNFDMIEGYKNRVLITLDNEFEEIKTNLVDDTFDEKVFFQEDILLLEELPILVKNIYQDLNDSSLVWFWELENNRGYKDALQFEFINEKTRKYNKIQFLVIGSSIQIYLLNEVNFNLNNDL